MRRTARFAVLPLFATAGFVVTAVPLSDPIGIYGVVDKVVLAPNATNPTSIQVWGAFSIGEQAPGDQYKSALKGYLYFSMVSGKEREIRAEWADLQSVAGKGQPIGFGAKWGRHNLPRVRCPSEAPADPDVYTTSVGIARSFTAYSNASATKIERDLKGEKIPTAPCRVPQK